MLKVISHYFPAHVLPQAIFDASVLFVAVLLAVVMQIQGGVADWRMIVPSALLFTIAMIVLNSAIGLYRVGGDGASARGMLWRVLISIMVSIPIAFGVFTVLPWGYFASEAVQLSVVLLLGLVLLMRGVVNRNWASSMFAPRVLILGTGADAAMVEHSLSRPAHSGMDVVGFYSPEGEERHAVDARRILGAGNGLLQTVKQLRVNEVIVAVRERRGGVLPIRELLDCKLCGIRVMDLSTFFERVQGKVRIDSLKPSWLIYGDGFRQSFARSAVKRCFDLVASIILLAVALPVMLGTALLILLEDGAPVFYRQERVGRGGRVFRVIKFRSMRRDAEKDGKPRWAQSSDDRTTRVGRVIRRLRIDELPQLFNVLIGDMSHVGPRPERPFFVDQLAREIPFYCVRHSVKPGVTGWAQVRYQYGASVEDAVQKLQYDLYYVKNHSLVLDTLVLFETVRVVLTGEGAH